MSEGKKKKKINKKLLMKKTGFKIAQENKGKDTY